MYISDQTWSRYISLLRKVNNTAAKEMFNYLAAHEWWTSEAARQAAVDYAFAISTKYGEAAAEAACELYDTIAQNFAKGFIRPAEPAATATYDETAKAMYGAMSRTRNINYIADVTGRLVKQASADTMTMNAIRDGAEWAWIPSGDSCAYCTMLASRGWQRASVKALRRGHAEHIHQNCDCNYCVRFDDSTTVEGYDPDALLEKYEKYRDESGGWKQGLKAMRRDHDAENRDKINAQKREAYAFRKGDGVWTYK